MPNITREGKLVRVDTVVVVRATEAQHLMMQIEFGWHGCQKLRGERAHS